MKIAGTRLVRSLVIPAAITAAAAMVFVSERSYRAAVEALDDQGDIAIATAAIRNLQWSSLEARTGARGHALTDDPSFRRARDRALRTTSEAFVVLADHYADEPAALAVLGEWQSSLSERPPSSGAVPPQSRRAETTQRRAAPPGRLGEDDSDLLWELGTPLLDVESRKVDASRHDIYRTLFASRIGVAALSIASVLCLLFYLRLRAALGEKQKDEQRQVRMANDRLEEEVASRTTQLTQLAHHLQSAREDERSRLARDLHDELGALLTSAKLDAARIRSRLPASAHDTLERLAHLVEMLDSVTTLKRRITENLRPSSLTHLGLAATLEILAREHAAASGIAVQCTLDPVVLTPAAELMIYRLAQESINNIAKHARATRIRMRLRTVQGRAEFCVHDDGCGFDPGKTPVSAHGLIGMRFRAEAEGGALEVSSAPGSGTSVCVTLPALQGTPEV